MKTFKTDHFNLSEFTYSTKAKANNIDNSPSEEVIDSLYALTIIVLEPARVKLDSPMTISSGYRCPALNKLVGGVSNSQHLLGEAADIQCKDIPTLRRLFAILQEGPVDQLLYEYSVDKKTKKKTYWVHVSFKSRNNRNMIRDNYLSIK